VKKKQASVDTDPLSGLMPENPLMAAAWVGCLRWALGREDIMTQFRAETGMTWTPGRTPIDQAIDEACGMILPRFCQMAQREHLGRAKR